MTPPATENDIELQDMTLQEVKIEQEVTSDADINTNVVDTTSITNNTKVPDNSNALVAPPEFVCQNIYPTLPRY